MVAAVTGSSHRVGRNRALSATSTVTARLFSQDWSWSGAGEPRWCIWTLAFTRACRADRLADASTWMASTTPSLGLARTRRLPVSTRRSVPVATDHGWRHAIGLMHRRLNLARRHRTNQGLVTFKCVKRHVERAHYRDWPQLTGPRNVNVLRLD